LKGSGVVDSFGLVLRTLRQQQGLSVAGLAKRVAFSRQAIGNVETGTYQPSKDLATALDIALGCSPLLATLLEIQKGGDDVNRRALLGTATAVGAGAVFAAADGTAAMAAVMDAGLRQAVGVPTDWDVLAADFARRHVLAPSTQLGSELLAQLSVARDRAAAGDRDASRGAASLAMTYALWLGDMGMVPTAAGLHATSAALADHSGDRHTMALVRARAANRGIYEGMSARRAQEGIDQALAITGKGTAALEAHAGAVHIAGLTGNLAAGERALHAMNEVAGDLPASDSPSPTQRVVSFTMYLHGRIGTLHKATQAYDIARRVLIDVQPWMADSHMYMALALVRDGQVDEGAKLALKAVRSLPAPVRVVGWGVRDVLAAAPKGARTEEMDQLRMFAPAGPAPWDTLR
jgi:DNA-binding XRE family transcriptional regulator